MLLLVIFRFTLISGSMTLFSSNVTPYLEAKILQNFGVEIKSAIDEKRVNMG